MSEKKKKEQEDLKLKQPTEAVVELGFVQEQEVQNVSDDTKMITATDGSESNHMSFSATIGIIDKEPLKIEINDLKFNVVYKEEAKNLLSFSLDVMKSKVANGATLDDVFYDMKNYILAYKDNNPDEVQRAISMLLGNAQNHYDEGTDNIFGISGFTRKHQGDSAEEILSKLLNLKDNEELDGFVCSTISEFGMRLLDECGIEATMIAGGTSGTNHTCLLWKRSDGKYVQSNYGDAHALKATNMKDAALEVYHKDYGLICNGFIYFIDNSGSYHEFAMKDEAAWGKELDKRFYNDQSMFNHTVAQKPSIQGRATMSNLGSIEAEISGTVAYGNNSVSKETTYSGMYKKSGKTSLADNSESLGLKLEHKSEKILPKGKKYSETKVVVDYTKLSTYSSQINNDYYNAMSDRTYVDENQVQELRDFYGALFDETVTLESIQEKYDNCTDYLRRYFELGNDHENCPVSKEDFINNYLSTYVDGSGNAYSDLNVFGKTNANKVAERAYRNYLLDNYYSEAYDIVKGEQLEYKNTIENFDEYRNSYIDEQLSELAHVYYGNDNPKIEINAFDTTHLTMFLRKVFGKEKTLLDDKGVKLTKGWQLSGTLGLNDVLTKTENNETEAVFSSFGGDFRLAAEEGLKLDLYNRTTLSSTALSGGLTTDFSMKSGTLTPSLTPGIKLNASTSLRTRLKDNLIFGAGLSGYSVVNRVSIDNGANGSLQAAYTPDGKAVTIFGSISTGLEKQRIRIGGFNELTENVKSLVLSLGAELGAKGSVSINYNRRDDKLNSTRNRAVYSVTAKINL